MSITALREHHVFLPKDYVETKNGLIFSVLCLGTEDQRVVGWLRYQREASGLRKLATVEAERLVRERHAQWHYYSPPRDVWLHGIFPPDIVRHYRPELWHERLPAGASAQRLALEKLLTALPDTGHGLRANTGVTGSLLLGAQRPSSDVDLVVYGRPAFGEFRDWVRQQFLQHSFVSSLTRPQWLEAYRRRACELTFEEYEWHERRKANKFSVAGIKFDLSCIDRPPADAQVAGHKLGELCIRALVTDASAAFDSPALYRVRHPHVALVLATTPTYAGQVERHEWLEAAGTLEACSSFQRLVVGGSREAPGEFIRTRG